MSPPFFEVTVCLSARVVLYLISASATRRRLCHLYLRLRPIKMPSTRSIIQGAVPLVLLGLSHLAGAFDNNRNDNLAVYWGQNSYGTYDRLSSPLPICFDINVASTGAGHSDTGNFQKTLSTYCADDSIDAFPIAFLNVFYSTGGLPSINLANVRQCLMSQSHF